MALNLESIVDNSGQTFTNAYGVVETEAGYANLGVWTDDTQEVPVRYAGLATYEVTEGSEEEDTITLLSAIGVSAHII